MRAGLAAVLAVLGLGCAAADDDASAPRALVLVTVDTLRADHLGAYGSDRGLTPRLDALADQSLVFEAVYAPAPFTVPSLVSLHSGRHPLELGLRINTSMVGDEAQTVAETLSARGWRTAAAVSNVVLRGRKDLAQGFEIYEDTMPQREAVRRWPERIAEGTTLAALTIVDLWQRDPAVREQPLFLWVHYQDPHGPYTPPEGFRERFLDAERARDPRRLPLDRSSHGDGGIPRYQRIGDHDEAAFYRAGYAGEIAYLDREIGVLLAGLRERGVGERIVFTADHGELLGEDDTWFAHGNDLTDPLLRVPLLVHLPGVAPGRRSDVAQLADLYPTLLGIALAAPPPSPPDTRDLLAEGAESAESVPLLTTLDSHPRRRLGLVADGYKLILTLESGVWSPRLFRLGEEEVDLAAPAPHVTRRLRERLWELRDRRSAETPAPLLPVTEQQRQNLEALGYLGRAGRMIRSAWVAAGLAALVLAVFAQTLEHDFVRYDDPIYVTENPLLVDGPSLEGMARAFQEPYEANWIPLTWISLQVDYAWHGLDPAGYHATNVVLHWLAALLLFAALARATGDALPAAFVAAVFAVHPLHVESVAWISERKDTLSAVFFALTLLLYARYAEAPSVLRYLAVAGATALGLLAKPMLVTLPCVLLLLDAWPLRRLGSARRIRRAVLEKLPLLGLAALASAAALHAQQRFGAMDHGELLPASLRVGNAVVAIALYLRDAIWPTGLSVFYPHPQDSLAFGQVAAATLLSVAITAACAWQWRRAPYALVGWLWFLGMLVPVLGLVQVGMQARADRYTYLPLVGPTIALAWGVRHAARTTAARRVAAVAGLASIGLLAVTAHAQAKHWRDTETLFRHAIDVDPANWFAYNSLGNALLRRNALDAADEAFVQAIRLEPNWSAPHRGRADVDAARGELARAIRGYERALRLTPGDERAHMRLARALAASGQTAEALGRARHAVGLASGGRRAEALVILGFVHLERAELRQAIAACERALATHPTLAEGHLVRGLALMRSGEYEKAAASLGRVQRLAGDTPEIQLSLAELATRRGRPDETRRHYERALALAEARGDRDLIERIRALRRR